MKWILFLLAGLFFYPAIIRSQPTSLYIPRNMQQAYQKHTRDYSGQPGARYWQNRADYRMDIRFNPGTRDLAGHEWITYYNNSPDTLKKLVFHLFPNFFRKGNARESKIDFRDETDGVRLESLWFNGQPVALSPDSGRLEFVQDSLNMELRCLVPPASQAKVELKWRFTVNKNSHVRTGMVDSTSAFVAYFFPRIAVYDDIDGWNHFRYDGLAEFYNDFGDFDVSVTVPQNFVVWATGELQDPEQVLREKYSRRLQKAIASDAVVHIVDSTEAISGAVTIRRPENTWRFKACGVSDFAFALSDHYLWDATSLRVDQKSGRCVLIQSAYDKSSRNFFDVIHIARQAIDYMSRKMPGVPFPFPSETVFNGLDEMEYPMMVNEATFADSHYVVKLTSHEIFHSYFPFMMGINENKYAWMDEGWASFGDYRVVSAIDGPQYATLYFHKSYKNRIGFDLDFPIFALSDYLKRPVYHHNSYVKPAAFLMILNDYLGQEQFLKAVHEYMRRWQGKHPMPYDFFFTLMDVTGQNLDWLIRPWFFKYGYYDLAIKNVRVQPRETIVTVENKGTYPAPVYLKASFTDGTEAESSLKADVWRDGVREVVIKLKNHGPPAKLELIDKTLIDADVSNNIWQK